MNETKEQLLIRRVFKTIMENCFNGMKLTPYYITNMEFDRKLGEDIAEYVKKHNIDYYNKKYREFFN